MRGQFIRSDGLILPNNISIAGSQVILSAALRNDYYAICAALVVGVPTLDMTIADMVEPTIGVNGYQRIGIPRTNVGWPMTFTIGNEFSIQSQNLVWNPTGPFDKPVQRIALVPNAAWTAGEPVLALSSPLPLAVIFDAATPPANRTFKYQLFL